jgi:hypothetical protein
MLFVLLLSYRFIAAWYSLPCSSQLHDLLLFERLYIFIARMP